MAEPPRIAASAGGAPRANATMTAPLTRAPLMVDERATLGGLLASVLGNGCVNSLRNTIQILPKASAT
jgi:hypothetical protein